MWRVKSKPTKSREIDPVAKPCRMEPWSLSPKSFGLLVSPWTSVFSSAPTYAQSPSRFLSGLASSETPLRFSTQLVCLLHTNDSFVSYPTLAWDGAAASHLSHLDRVQHRSLLLLGPGVVVDSLSIRRQVIGFSYLFKWAQGTSNQTAGTTPTVPTSRSQHETSVSTRKQLSTTEHTPCALLQPNSAIFSLQAGARLEHRPARSPAVTPSP